MSLFTTLIYQPFFNLLVGIYWAIDQFTGGQADMGIAVIIFTIVFRILWLPVSFASGRSARERHDISEKIKAVKTTFAQDQLRLQEEMKQLMHGNRRTIIMSSIDLFFQIMVMLMLYRIFTTGLEGADFHLIYTWMPPHPEEFNLTFLGKFDLSHPNWTINLINAGIIFLAELIGSFLSPFPTGRTELMTLFVLP